MKVEWEKDEFFPKKTKNFAFSEALIKYRENFDLFYRKFYHPVLKETLGVLRNEEDAEDASQDAFISTHKGLAGFRGNTEGELVNWTLKTAQRAAFKIKEKRQTKRCEAFEDNEHGEPDNHDLDSKKEEINKILNGIKSNKVKKTIYRHYVQGETVNSIAEKTNTPRKTIYNRLAEFKKKVKKHLKG